MSYGWNGTRARNEDGREGVIRENMGWGWVDLHIENGEVELGHVQLRVDAPDKGDRGWTYLHVGHDGSERWFDLGNFD